MRLFFFIPLLSISLSKYKDTEKKNCLVSLLNLWEMYKILNMILKFNIKIFNLIKYMFNKYVKWNLAKCISSICLLSFSMSKVISLFLFMSAFDPIMFINSYLTHRNLSVLWIVPSTPIQEVYTGHFAIPVLKGKNYIWEY